MLNILYFIAGVALGFWVKGRTSKSFLPRSKEEMEEIREEAMGALAERTEHRKEKILEFMKNEAIHQKELEACNPGKAGVGVVRADIEKLLEVSDTTARKYLNELEAENKIKQMGENGRDVYYTLSL
jgi:predicted HTH transcriptional regulator